LFFSSSKFNCFAEVTESAKYSAVFVTAILPNATYWCHCKHHRLVETLSSVKELMTTESLRLAAVSFANGLSLVVVV
jgi:hypothetical protein